MPASKNLAAYPERFFRLADKIPAALPLTFVFDDDRQAKAERFSLYYFIRALSANNHPDAPKMAGALLLVRENTLVITNRDVKLGRDPITEVLDKLDEKDSQTESTPPAEQAEQHEEVIEDWMKK